MPISIGSLNVMLNAEFTGTFVCPFITLLLTTYGPAQFGCAAVVKCVVVVATAFPASLVTPLIATVITVLGGIGACGVIDTRV